MGTDPETPTYDPGADCNVCKDVIFDGVTPLYVEAHVQNIIDCPGPPTPDVNAVIPLIQVLPCAWAVTINGVLYAWTLNIGSSVFGITGGGGFFFTHVIAATCQTMFTNTLLICTGFPVFSIGGTAEIFWGPTIGP